MSNNVLINGRSAVHAGSQGTLTTVDVCKTQIGNSVVPIPYTNIAQSKDADKTASDVFINGYLACHLKSVFSTSTGDEAGQYKGIISGSTQGKASFVSGSTNVFMEGQPAVRAGDMMVSNNKNTPPAPLIQAADVPPLADSADTPETEEPADTGRVTSDQYAQRSSKVGHVKTEPSEQ